MLAACSSIVLSQPPQHAPETPKLWHPQAFSLCILTFAMTFSGLGWPGILSDHL